MQLENKREQLAERGIHIAAVSYDSVAVLKHFADRKNITFPLLSDPDSKIIRDFGILNESIREDHQFFGIPHPGEYLLNAEGVVQEKFFEQYYRDRFTAGTLLVRRGARPTGETARKLETDHLSATSWASEAVVCGGNRFALALEVELPEKMHVYAPSVEGYIPIDWKLTEADGLTIFGAEYPQPEQLHLPAIGETMPVYEGTFRIVRDVMIGQRGDIGSLLDGQDNIVLRGELRYQACDDKVCYVPETVPLEFKVKFADHDRTRAPAELRKID